MQQKTSSNAGREGRAWAFEKQKNACSGQIPPYFNFQDLPDFSATSSSVALIAALEQPSCCEEKSSIVPTLLSSGLAITSAFNSPCRAGLSAAGVFFDAADDDAASAWNASVGAGGGAIALAGNDVCLVAAAGTDVAVDGAGSQ